MHIERLGPSPVVRTIHNKTGSSIPPNEAMGERPATDEANRTPHRAREDTLSQSASSHTFALVCGAVSQRWWGHQRQQMQSMHTRAIRGICAQACAGRHKGGHQRGFLIPPA